MHGLLCEGYTDVVDADLSKYLDTIPHSELLQCVAKRIVDKHMLHLIKMWLKAPVEERDEEGKKRVTGGKDNDLRHSARRRGQPAARQSLHEPILKDWRADQTGRAVSSQMVTYADDFVILSRGKAAEALEWTREVMTRAWAHSQRGEDAHSASAQESFNFLGYTFGPHRYRKDGHWYLGASPSKKAVLGSRRKWEICWCLGIWEHGQKCGIG